MIARGCNQVRPAEGIKDSTKRSWLALRDCCNQVRPAEGIERGCRQRVWRREELAATRYDPLRVLKVVVDDPAATFLHGAATRYDPLRVLKGENSTTNNLVWEPILKVLVSSCALLPVLIGSSSLPLPAHEYSRISLLPPLRCWFAPERVTPGSTGLPGDQAPLAREVPGSLGPGCLL